MKENDARSKEGLWQKLIPEEKYIYSTFFLIKKRIERNNRTFSKK